MGEWDHEVVEGARARTNPDDEARQATQDDPAGEDRASRRPLHRKRSPSPV